jgi:hypothetical protein
LGKLLADMKKKNLIFFTTLILLLFIFSISCDAPRDNPVDPNNTNNLLSTISGLVKTLGYPYSPIHNVNVSWENENVLVQTDENGKYYIPNLIQKNGWLKFDYAGYSNDSLFINWNDNNLIASEIFLNSIPKLDSLEFFSTVENRFQFNQKYSIKVRARVSDFEGVNDIVSVSIENEELSLLKILTYNHIQDFYEGTFTLSDLKIASLNEIIGKDFKILVSDLEENIFSIGVTNIKRIINEDIVLISPINNETVNEQLKLIWTRFTPGYNFKYRVEVFTNETPPIMVYSKQDIAKDEISHIVGYQFDGTNYFWVIWAIDEFNNQSRSKPGSFIIGN